MIALYDTTLRDGEQHEGISLTVEDKLRIVTRLDALGVAYIEGGYPASNPIEALFYREVAALNLKHATISAFGRVPPSGMNPFDDDNLRALAASQAQVVTLAGMASQRLVTEVLEMGADENLHAVDAAIRYLTQHDKRVFFDAEHFFDGYKHSPTYALAVLLTAWGAGADALVLCDSNGGVLPSEIYKTVRTAVGALRGGGVAVPVGIRAHNDSGCAVANSLEAVRAGATQVQGSINGYGARVGNTDLLVVLANLQLKMAYELVSPEQLAQLTATSLLVSEVFEIDQDANQPYVGLNAFAHDPFDAPTVRQQRANEHINPASVGNSPASGEGGLIDEESLLEQVLDSRRAHTGDNKALALLERAMRNVSTDYLD
ncbi:MAG: hypothetical protein LBU31_04165 [Coriobacteriales bacterium]|jgi:2-isopropylmalate synthase|nr:hypothetical protein [Coriobacteriales bacterium]